MKKKRGLIYGITALAVLCVIYGGVGRYMARSQEQAEQKMEGDKAYLTALSNVSSVSYNLNDQELSFTKKDGEWKYDGDDLFPVKQSEVESVASTVSKLEALRRRQPERLWTGSTHQEDHRSLRGWDQVCDYPWQCHRGWRLLCCSGGPGYALSHQLRPVQRDKQKSYGSHGPGRVSCCFRSRHKQHYGNESRYQPALYKKESR